MREHLASFFDAFPYGLIVAMASGLFGAAFFMLIELQRRLSEGGLADIRDMWTWRLLLLRCVVGLGAAAILYFFFESKLLVGDIWPRLQALYFNPVQREVMNGTAVAFEAIGQRQVPNKDFALLVIWSFVAGYSQTLVPNLLIATESRSSKPAK